MGRVEQLELSTQKNKQPLRGSQPTRQMGPVVCRRYGQPSHFTRGCAQPRLNAPQKTKTNPVEPNALPTFSINNVSSYLLSCSIYGSPVSFLVDTGAGVSLLSK